MWCCPQNYICLKSQQCSLDPSYRHDSHTSLMEWPMGTARGTTVISLNHLTLLKIGGCYSQTNGPCHEKGHVNIFNTAMSQNRRQNKKTDILKICKNMNSVQQQREHHHWKVLIESFHLSGHTFWSVQDLKAFVVQSNTPLVVKGLRSAYNKPLEM